MRRQLRRVNPILSIAGAAVLVAGLGIVVAPSMSLAAATLGPYTIDGTVPGGDGGTAITDPAGSNKELGPVNASSTKIGVIHTDAVPTLGDTNPNAQVDLNTVWLDLQRDGSADYLYFAWQRDSNSGSGFIAYEFMHTAAPTACAYDTASAASLAANCNPWANRSAGDFMILWDQQGGSQALTKRVWGPPGATGANLVLGGSVALGANAQALYSSDGFQGEAAVNLTGAGLTSGSGCTVLANTIPSTVTGNSDTADYKDTVLTTKRLSTCKDVNIVKVDDTTPTANPLQGAVFKLYNNVLPLAGPRDTSATSTADTITNPLLTCTTGADGKCSIANVPFGEYWAVETTTPANHDTAADQRVTVASNSTTAGLTLTFVDPRQRGSIIVKKVDTLGGALSGASFTVSPGSGTMGPSGTNGILCIDNLLYNTYTVHESQAPFGYTAAADQTFAVSTKSNCATRLAGTYTPDLTFIDSSKPGTINILKKDDANNPLIAGFTLFKDVGTVGTYEPATDTVAQAGPTNTASDGTLQFASVPLGSYCVVETTTPAGYATAPAQCVTIALNATGQVENLTFVNPRKHKVIVIVCHEGSNTLDSSPVTVGSSTKSSLATAPSGFTAADLCGLGGATFGGLGHGSTSASVNVQ
jgi:hypothetical protein